MAKTRIKANQLEIIEILQSADALASETRKGSVEFATIDELNAGSPVATDLVVAAATFRTYLGTENYLKNVVDDTNPLLGGTLDVADNLIQNGTATIDLNDVTASVIISADGPTGQKLSVSAGSGGIDGDGNGGQLSLNSGVGVGAGTVGGNVQITMGTGVTNGGDLDLLFDGGLATGNINIKPLLPSPFLRPELRFFEADPQDGSPSDNTQYVALRSPANISEIVVWTLPQDTHALANGKFLTTDGAGVLSFAAAGGGTPGGADTQIQYNNGGAFGGAVAWTFDDTTVVGKLTATASIGSDSVLSVTNSSTSGTPIGIYGNASGGTGANKGVYGESSSITPGAAGVFGRTNGSNSAVAGVYGYASEILGIAVYGFCPHASGTGTAIHGEVNGAGAAGGLFENKNGDQIAVWVAEGTNIIRADNNAVEQFKVTDAGVLTAETIDMKAFSETALVLPAASGSPLTTIVDTAAATYHYGTLTGIPTFTFSNPAASGKVTTFTLEITAGATYAPVWPASVKWPGGTEPTWTTGIDVVSFITRDAGVTWLGMLGGTAFS